MSEFFESEADVVTVTFPHIFFTRVLNVAFITDAIASLSCSFVI